MALVGGAGGLHKAAGSPAITTTGAQQSHSTLALCPPPILGTGMGHPQKTKKPPASSWTYAIHSTIFMAADMIAMPSSIAPKCPRVEPPRTPTQFRSGNAYPHFQHPLPLDTEVTVEAQSNPYHTLDPNCLKEAGQQCCCGCDCSGTKSMYEGKACLGLEGR